MEENVGSVVWQPPHRHSSVILSTPSVVIPAVVPARIIP